MSAEHVTWLCVVAAALTVAVLAFSALNKDGLAGFCLILYCLILLVAIFALAYAPIAVALPGVFSTPSHDCQILGHVMHFAFLASFLLLLFRVNLIFTTMRSARMTAWCRNKESASCAKLLPKLLILGTLVVAVAFALGALGGRMGGAKLGYYENIVTIDQCWFPNQNWFLILYTLPLAVSVAISYILLAAVCLRMRAVTGETAQLKAGNNLPSPGQIRADQKSLMLGAVALVAMTITLVAEVLCFLQTWPHFWLPFSVLLVIRAFVLLLVRAVPPRAWRVLCCSCSKVKSSWNPAADDDKNDKIELASASTKDDKNPFSE